MRHLNTPLSLLCAATLLTSCSGESVPAPTFPTPSPSPPAQPATNPAMVLTSTLTLITGAECVLRDPHRSTRVGVAEQHEFSMQRSGTKITLGDHNDWRMGTMYAGEVIGRDFTASAYPSRFAFSCSDGTPFDVTFTAEVVGRLSDDERELTATLRERFVGPGDFNVLTSSYTWIARQQ